MCLTKLHLNKTLARLHFLQSWLANKRKTHLLMPRSVHKLSIWWRSCRFSLSVLCFSCRASCSSSSWSRRTRSDVSSRSSPFAASRFPLFCAYVTIIMFESVLVLHMLHSKASHLTCLEMWKWGRVYISLISDVYFQHRRRKHGGSFAPLVKSGTYFSGKYHVKFGHFVNFSYTFLGKNIFPPQKKKLTELLEI